jgi:hypothetical protein
MATRQGFLVGQQVAPWAPGMKLTARLAALLPWGFN